MKSLSTLCILESLIERGKWKEMQLLSIGMHEKELEEALVLCREVRIDLKELAKLWAHRSLEDAHAASEFSSRMGEDHEKVVEQFDLLEISLSRQDMRAIALGEWPVYDLVNYYDTIIDRVQFHQMSSNKRGKEVKLLQKWRSTAGRLAQLICHLEDAC